MCAPAISYLLENEVAFTLHFQLCSTLYIVLQTKNDRRSASAINPVTMENMDDFCLQAGKAMHLARAKSSQQKIGHKGGQR